MTQWIRGQQGLVDELTRQRARLQTRLNLVIVKAKRADLQSQIWQLNDTIAWLSSDAVQILTVAEYDANMAKLDALQIVTADPAGRTA